MAWIDSISPDDAKGELRRLYERLASPDGSVDHIMQVHALNPESLAAHGALYVQSMHGRSGLSRAEREMIAVEVSRVNACEY